MQHEAARPKGDRAAQDAPHQEPMKGNQPSIRRNPSTDQKKVRRQMQRSASLTACAACAGPSTGSCRACGCTVVTAGAWDAPLNGERDFGTCRACQGHGRDYTNQVCKECGGTGEKRTASVERRQVEATVLDGIDAWRLNPGDQLVTPTGQTMKVHRIRQHEQSAGHVYVDTDQGTTLVTRDTKFQTSPSNTRQQELPGFGTPGANTNKLPFSGHGGPAGASNQMTSNACPNCGAKGALVRQGDKYVCSRCGYQTNIGGPGGQSFSDSTTQSIQPGRRAASLSPQFTTAIARRAHEVLTSQEDQSE